MKTPLVLGLFLAFSTVPAFADTPFPGIQTIMTPAEYARAGLDRLTPDQIGVIDAAIIRHYARTVDTAVAQQTAQVVQQATQQATAAEHKRGVLDRFGLPTLSQEWRDQPALKAHCTGWVGGNSFKLDNGQVWEGTEPIPVEIANRDIEIQPRPGGSFSLIVEGKNTTIRVRRVK